MPAVKTETPTEITFTSPTDQQPITEPAKMLPATVAEGSTVLSLIERAARDPAVDIDKMERLILMQERIHARMAQADYDTAMANAQEEMKAIRADAANTQTKSKYATYAALDHATRPIYSKHGFALSFNTGDAPKENEVRVLCTVSHRGGHRQDYKIDMPADGKGPQGAAVMTRTHATGAAASYGQRYLLKLIFNLAVGDVDDDGNGADGDVENLASGPRDPETGKLLSTYDATKANKAKDNADQAIQLLNTLNAEQARDWRTENYKAPKGSRVSFLGWIQANSPGQWHRVKTCYENITGEEL